MLRRTLSVLVPVALLATGATSASAATLTVNTGFDTTGQSQSCSLRDAISAVDSPGAQNSGCAAAAFGGNTIMLPAGTYNLGGPGSSNATLQIGSTVTKLTIEGTGSGTTTINGAALGARPFTIAAGANVTISDLTITAGHAGSQPPANGGAIANAGTLSLVDTSITNSAAGGGGSGFVGSGQLASTGAAGADGGGVYNTGTLALSGVTMSGDSAGNGANAAVVGTCGTGATGATGTSGATGSTGVVFTGPAGGAGGNGGAIANAGGSVLITQSTFNGDRSGTGGNGGGNCVASPGAVGAGGSGGNGGAIATKGGTISISNSTIASDATGAGGSGEDGAPAGAAGRGGALVTDAASAVAMNSDTIAGNSSGTGAIYGPAPNAVAYPLAGVTVQDSLFASNSGGTCADGGIVDAGHNLDFGDSTCPASFLAGDPDLGPLQNNGGPADTIAPQAGSAAIDAVPASGAGCPATDERGVARPVGSGCDIGAYEVAPPVLKSVSAGSLAPGGATINVTVIPNAGSAGIELQYGRTTAYAAAPKQTTATGVTGVVVPITLRALKPKTTYHYKLTVTTPDGTAASTDQTFTTPGRPGIKALKVKSGPTIIYTAATKQTTTFTVRRVARKQSRVLTTFTHKDKPGKVSIHLNAKLKAGHYRLTATPRAGTAKGKAVNTTFTIE